MTRVVLRKESQSGTKIFKNSGGMAWGVVGDHDKGGRLVM